MKQRVVSVIALAGLCAAVNAATTVEILVSTDGVNFASTMLFTPGSGLTTYEVMVRVSTTNTAALGLHSIIFQPTVSNWRATDALLPFTESFGGPVPPPTPDGVPDAPGEYGRISPWALVANTTSQRLIGHVHLASGGANQPPTGTYLRIAQAQVTSWIGGTGNTSGNSGVNIRQLNNIGRTASDPAFVSQITDVRVFRFGIQLDTNVAGRSSIIIDAPRSGFGNVNTATGNREVHWFADMNEPAGSIREMANVIPATIVVPGPGVMGVLGLGILSVARRRRS